MNSSPCSHFATTARILRAVVVLIGLAFAPLAFSQGIVTAGITGTVRDTGGKTIAGVAVTATHVPTGTIYTAATTDTGRYNFRGLIAGGPYTVAISGPSIKAAERTNLTASIGTDLEVNFAAAGTSGEIVALEKFNVKGDTNELDAGAMGAGSLLTSARLAAKPTTQRSFADVISASPFVTLRSLSSANDREEAHITALGQNNRYNSILIDGARINDQFGLNGTGLASFFNPLSLDTIEQMSVQVSPYETRESGFTGASVNAVTKSGTNPFHGSVYY
ncbi:MAG: carboxypeptidase regulatory-like domain-containing protein, partial [Verrucomicrobia bacterium]|nr:carboxypeptidase regulatory-like domain-containing protein [Verrucomicrobiota bacterium]